jgi:hypothetical protein
VRVLRVDDVYPKLRGQEQPTAIAIDLGRGRTVALGGDKKPPALYRLQLLILRLHNNWEKYSLDQRQREVPATNNATERAIASGASTAAARVASRAGPALKRPSWHVGTRSTEPEDSGWYNWACFQSQKLT